YHCGKVDHVIKDCDICFNDAGNLLSRKKHPYGPWLPYQGPLKPISLGLKLHAEAQHSSSTSKTASASASSHGDSIQPESITSAAPQAASLAPKLVMDIPINSTISKS
ncbi:MAG: hypothetical protein Q8870_02445, partial [Sweet potato little leaf phytoplasma]|nr:hypothetical protein [Sweet potato little leaf phytoplasma]